MQQGINISFWPIIDSLARYERAKAKGNEELVQRHGGFFLTVDAQIAANLMRMLERGEKAVLPFLLLDHGTADDSVPYELVTRFAQLYRVAGGDATAEPSEGAHRLAREGATLLAGSRRWLLHDDELQALEAQAKVWRLLVEHFNDAIVVEFERIEEAAAAVPRLNLTDVEEAGWVLAQERAAYLVDVAKAAVPRCACWTRLMR